jgi:hypothetical protein
MEVAGTRKLMGIDEVWSGKKNRQWLVLKGCKETALVRSKVRSIWI